MHYKLSDDGRGVSSLGGPQPRSAAAEAWDPARGLALGFSTAPCMPHSAGLQATSWLALGVLLLHAVAQAYGLAGAVLSGFGDSAHLLLPLVIAGGHARGVGWAGWAAGEWGRECVACCNGQRAGVPAACRPTGRRQDELAGCVRQRARRGTFSSAIRRPACLQPC